MHQKLEDIAKTKFWKEMLNIKCTDLKEGIVQATALSLHIKKVHKEKSTKETRKVEEEA